MKIKTATSGLAVLATLGLLIPHASAQITTWTGANSTNWGDSLNWSGPVPTGSDTAVFDDTAVGNFSMSPGDSSAGARNAFGIQYNNVTNAYFMSRGTGSYSLNSITYLGNRINLGTEDLVKTGAASVTIEAALIMGGSRVIDVASGSGLLQVGQMLSSSSDLRSVSKNGDGTAEFYSHTSDATNANNSGIGNLFVNDGTLNLNKQPNRINYNSTMYVGPTDGSGAAGSVIVETLQDDQLSGNGLAIYNAGRLDIGTTTQNFDGTQLRMVGGDIFFDAGGVLNLGAATATITNVSSSNSRQTRISAASTGTLNLGAATTTITVDNTVSGSDMRIDAVVAGSGDVVKNQDGVLLYGGSQSNTLTGTTTIQDGSLQLSKSGGAVGLAGDVVVQSTATTVGTLLLTGGAGQLASGIDVTFEGGTFDIRANETVNSLTLLTGGAAQATSVLNFNTASAVNFTIDTAATYTSGGLSILNWNGSLSGGGTDQFLFNFDPSPFVTALGSNIVFDGFGAGANVIDRGAGLFEVVAVPEPTTVGLLLVAGAAMMLRFRRRG